MRIVDAHHHLWDLQACHYPWLMQRGVPRFFGDPTPIQKNYLVDDFLDDAASFDLAASVHIQVGVAEGDELLETDWLESCAREHGLPSAIVAFCDLSAPDAGDTLEELAKRPHLRGIRQIIGRAEAEDRVTRSGELIHDPAWRENFSSLPGLGLSFDLQMTPPQAASVVDVIARYDQVPVALCHCGSPWDQTRRGLEHWRDGIARLAELPRAHCKLSGFGMFDSTWTVDTIAPIVEACIECFGIERCMFGSNFPVDKLVSSYDRLWQAYATICAQLSDNDRARLFRDNAMRFYRIPESAVVSEIGDY